MDVYVHAHLSIDVQTENDYQRSNESVLDIIFF
jgi:hypothetical protein